MQKLPNRFDTVSIILHWSVAIAIVAGLTAASGIWVALDLTEGGTRGELSAASV